MRYSILLFVYLLCFCNFYAQKNAYIEKHEAYFDMPRESLFIHLNKSKFVDQETLWLKGYALDRQNNKLHQNITNVNLGVYNSKGQLKESKMLLANNGIFISQIEIDSTFTPGRYYLKAMTHYMNNFKESDVFIEAFEVVDQIKPLQLPNQELNIKVKAEGQNFVYNLKNKLGIKIENSNGQAVKATIKLLENNHIIKQVNSSNNGLASLNFTPVIGNNYQLNITTAGGFTKTHELKAITSSGFTLQLNKVKDYVYINISGTNDLKNQALTLFVHQESKFITKEFKLENKSKQFAIPQTKLFEGLNTILILKNGQPVIERIYFNKTSDVDEFRGTYSVNSMKNMDSLTVNLNFRNEEQLWLSASVLSKEQITYSTTNTIKKSFRFQPYIKPNSYKMIQSLNRNLSRAEMDIVMLLSESKFTQNIVNFTPPKRNYKRQNGANQVLRLNQKLKKNDVLLLGVATQFNKEFTEYLNDRTVFNYKNRYPITNEIQKFALVTQQRNFVAPDMTLEHKFVFQDQKKINFEDYVLTFTHQNPKTNISSSRIIANFTNTNELDEVLISTSKKSEKKKKIELVRGDKVEITKDEVKQFFKLSVYLRYKGFNVIDQQGTFSVRTFSQRSISGSNEVTIILDGARLSDTSFLSDIPLNQFESVTINRSGFGEGVFGANGVIKLESRRTALYGGENPDLFTEVKIKDGFAPIKQFKNPNYNFFDKTISKQLNAIAWFPNLIIPQDNTNQSLRILDNELNSIVIFIEGISEEGQLHSYKIPINLKQ